MVWKLKKIFHQDIYDQSNFPLSLESKPHNLGSTRAHLERVLHFIYQNVQRWKKAVESSYTFNRKREWVRSIGKKC